MCYLRVYAFTLAFIFWNCVLIYFSDTHYIPTIRGISTNITDLFNMDNENFWKGIIGAVDWLITHQCACHARTERPRTLHLNWDIKPSKERVTVSVHLAWCSFLVNKAFCKKTLFNMICLIYDIDTWRYFCKMSADLSPLYLFFHFFIFSEIWKDQVPGPCTEELCGGVRLGSEALPQVYGFQGQSD